MASQIFTVATIGGRSSERVRALFSKWELATREAPEDSSVVLSAVDAFCDALRLHRTELPILYYAEWIDRWLFGRDASDSTWVSGRRFEACCLSRAEAAKLTDARHQQFQEGTWLLSRIREASSAWELLSEAAAILIVREVFSGSTLDADVVATLPLLAEWLSTDFDP